MFVQSTQLRSREKGFTLDQEDFGWTKEKSDTFFQAFLLCDKTAISRIMSPSKPAPPDRPARSILYFGFHPYPRRLKYLTTKLKLTAEVGLCRVYVSCLAEESINQSTQRVHNASFVYLPLGSWPLRRNKHQPRVFFNGCGYSGDQKQAAESF
jgi:hypothetical protein